MDEIKFEDISYELMSDIADLLMVEPIKKPEILIDRGYDYPTIGYFKCWLEDLDLGLGNMPNFGSAFYPDSMFTKRPVVVFLVAVEGKIFTVEETISYMFSKVYNPIYFTESKINYSIPYNFLFVSELEEIYEPVSFLRQVYINERGQKGTNLEIFKSISKLN